MSIKTEQEVRDALETTIELYVNNARKGANGDIHYQETAKSYKAEGETLAWVLNEYFDDHLTAYMKAQKKPAWKLMRGGEVMSIIHGTYDEAEERAERIGQNVDIVPSI